MSGLRSGGRRGRVVVRGASPLAVLALRGSGGLGRLRPDAPFARLASLGRRRAVLGRAAGEDLAPSGLVRWRQQRRRRRRVRFWSRRACLRVSRLRRGAISGVGTARPSECVLELFDQVQSAKHVCDVVKSAGHGLKLAGAGLIVRQVLGCILERHRLMR